MPLDEVIRSAAALIGAKAKKPKAETPPMTDDEDETAAEGDMPDDEEAPTAEGDMPDDEEEDDAPAPAFAKGKRAGATAERARIKAILSHAGAEANPALAAHLALETDMAPGAAAKALAAAASGAKAAPPSLANRMAGYAGKTAGVDKPGSGNALADAIDRLVAKRAK